jgi:uncharacterized protein
MAETTLLADTSFLVALLDDEDGHHGWAVSQLPRLAPPWHTCDAVLSEAYFLLGRRGGPAITALLRRGAVIASFGFHPEREAVLRLIEKYANVPMSLADACLVRMSETHPDPIVLTTDADFRIYRRHSRQVVPCAMPE